ncbi:unnamed protein product [Dovyalis caffra]|uniref:Uncharacterized protein n=1 Tax=Dovyalis caffra TaxID=77055 RepID=A0AAV1SET6_9ROSI|nr:unnamed protein product [Dovyalis caffra]
MQYKDAATANRSTKGRDAPKSHAEYPAKELNKQDRASGFKFIDAGHGTLAVTKREMPTVSLFYPRGDISKATHASDKTYGWIASEKSHVRRVSTAAVNAQESSTQKVHRRKRN